MGYDAIRVLLDAIKKDGSIDVVDVQQALPGSTSQGLSAPIYFDQVGQAHKDLALVRIADGERQSVTHVSP